MKSMLVNALVISVVAAPLPAAQQHPGLATGIRQVQEGDIEAAAVTLSRAAEELIESGSQDAELARTLAYLALVHQGLGEADVARADMVEAVRHDPALQLDPSQFPPRLLQLLAEVRKDQSPPAGPVLAPAPVPAPQPVVRPAVRGLASGSRVRVSSPATSGRLIVGTVTALGDGSVTVRGEESATSYEIALADALRLEVSEGKRSSGKRALLAGLGGALVFGAAGFAYGGGSTSVIDQECVRFYNLYPGELIYVNGGTLDAACTFEEEGSKGKWGALGAGVGAALGAVIGITTAKEVWRPTDRVALGVSPASGGVWLSLSF
jgi:hypothetical protein